MNALRNVLRLAAPLAALTLFATSASAAVDEDMKSLASKSGCLTCHSIESGAPGPNGMAPIGPAWQDVAKMYQGKPGADAFLTRVVLEGGCRLSMDGRGAWRDNVFVERLWRSVKYERVYLKAYDSVSAARGDIAEYLAWYNAHRGHSSLDRLTPDEAYFAGLPALKLAA